MDAGGDGKSHERQDQRLPGRHADAWKEITIRHVLSQTSGVGDVYFGPQPAGGLSEEAMGKKGRFRARRVRTGRKWKYSNTGYVLLGVNHPLRPTGQSRRLPQRAHLHDPGHERTARNISEADIISKPRAGYRIEQGD